MASVPYVPNEITPTAWNMPPLMVSNGVVKEPLSAKGVRAPCMTTVDMMMVILMRASVLAFASCIAPISSGSSTSQNWPAPVCLA